MTMQPTFTHDGYSVLSQFQRMAQAEAILYDWACECIDTSDAKRECLELGFDIDFRQPDRGGYVYALDTHCDGEPVRIDF